MYPLDRLYKVTMCKYGSACTDPSCRHAHNVAELRPDPRLTRTRGPPYDDVRRHPPSSPDPMDVPPSMSPGRWRHRQAGPIAPKPRHSAAGSDGATMPPAPMAPSPMPTAPMPRHSAAGSDGATMTAALMDIPPPPRCRPRCRHDAAPDAGVLDASTNRQGGHDGVPDDGHDDGHDASMMTSLMQATIQGHTHDVHDDVHDDGDEGLHHGHDGGHDDGLDAVGGHLSEDDFWC